MAAQYSSACVIILHVRAISSNVRWPYTVKNIPTSMDILCVASLPYFHGTGSVYVCIRKSTETRVSLFRRFTDTTVYGTSCVKIWKTRRAQNIRGYFYSVRVDARGGPINPHVLCNYLPAGFDRVQCDGR